MRGIILAGGNGIRLLPISNGINKHLMPIYDKPMIYYSLSILMMAKIKEVLIITKGKDIPRFEELLGDGDRLGIKIEYAQQNIPNGIAEAFTIGKKFIGKEDVCLVLGDNVIYGDGFVELLKDAKNIIKRKKNAVIFGYKVNKPNEFGVIQFKKKKIDKILEKPKKTKSSIAAIGLYFYPNKVLNFSIKIKKSKRSELEITDINNIFIKQKKIKLIQLGRGTVWYDAGNPNNLLKISNLIYNVQSRNMQQIACIEEIAYRNKWIDRKKLNSNLRFVNGQYKKYILKILNEK